MTNQPLLTAVIFTYNHKNSIAKCIESLVNQKTRYKYEIHICDDASIDGTTDICDRYAKEYSDKIRYFLQTKNTFCGPYKETHFSQEIQRINTKYFCIIDGDDYWCNENKIQMALDFLEKNPKYIGWAHDTLQVNEFDGTEVSYIHDICKIDKIKNPVTFSADAPFFLISSRIFRNVDYASKNILPIDYQVYYYHLSKGYIYYCDEIMAVYNISSQSTWASKVDLHLILIFSFKLAQLFNFKQDEFCTAMLKLKINEFKQHNGKKYVSFNNLLILKKMFGVKFGWYIWVLIYFVPKYGFEIYGKHYIYANRIKTKKESDKRCNNVIQVSDIRHQNNNSDKNSATVAIMQPYFFPYLGYWQLMNAVNKYVIYDDVNFIKGGWINRNYILSLRRERERELITMPLNSISSFTKIKDLNIANDPKAIKKILTSITLTYKKAPYYDSIMPKIATILTSNTNISVLNYKAILMIKDYLEIDTQIILHSNMKDNDKLKGQDKVIFINKQLGAKKYFNAIGGIDLYNKKDFKENGLELYFLKTNEYIKYKQFSQNFIPNLSIIDVLMFNSPKEIKRMLNAYTLI